MSVHSFSGYNYCVTFIDDYSRKTWIYFLKANSEVFEQFWDFMALMENQTGRKIRVLRTNNKGEYIYKDFLDFCSSNGIKNEHIVPHNPQQNGVAERKNRILVGAAKAMLFD